MRASFFSSSDTIRIPMLLRLVHCFNTVLLNAEGHYREVPPKIGCLQILQIYVYHIKPYLESQNYGFVTLYLCWNGDAV